MTEKKYSTYQYYPDRWTELKEVLAIIKATQDDGSGGFDTAAQNLIQSLENVFLLEDNQGNGGADEYGCERWENILGITPKAGSSLSDRRYAIWLKTLDPRPYTWHNLRALLNELLGSEDQYVITRDVEAKKVHIRIFSDSLNQQDLIMEFLDELIPADMILTMEQYFNRYYELKASGRTFAQMNEFTYDEMQKDIRATQR